MIHSYETLKKNTVVGYKLNDDKYYRRGRALSVTLTDKGIKVSIEDIDTHYMYTVPYNELIFLKPLNDLDRECIMPIEEFIELVETGFITDYDGSGNYSDGEYRYGYVDFYPSFLKNAAKKYKYVCWYNK